jgi:Tol biopolymer transport system component
VRLLVSNAADAAVSPDGSRIAFVREGGIWSMARDGSDQRRITKTVAKSNGYPGSKTVEDGDPAWSVDGRRIYFSRMVWKTLTASIFSVRADGTGLRRLTRPPEGTGYGGSGTCHSEPVPLPRGHIVLFDSTSDCLHGFGLSIRAVTSAGRSARVPFRLPPARAIRTGDELLQYAPAPSPGGRLLAEALIDSDASDVSHIGKSGIYISSSDGPLPRRIARAAGPSAPAWSPDGAWIAFGRDALTGDHAEICLVRADGASFKVITPTRARVVDGSPAWLPSVR